MIHNHSCCHIKCYGSVVFLLYRHVFMQGQVRAKASAKHHQWHPRVLIVRTQAQCDIITTGHDATHTTHSDGVRMQLKTPPPPPEVHSRHAFLSDPWPRTSAWPRSLTLTSDLWPLAGANPTLKNELGHTPLTYAKEGEMLTLLKESQNTVNTHDMMESRLL